MFLIFQSSINIRSVQTTDNITMDSLSHDITDSEFSKYGTANTHFSVPLEKIILTWNHINVFSNQAQGSGLASLASLISGRKGTYIQGLGKNKPVIGRHGISTCKHILKNVRGIIEPGTLLAVMGSSGAGKTTLLNVLTFRNKGNLVIQGEVRINGVKIEKAMPGVSCYVQQENLFSPTITVKEQLWFHSQLRMDRGTTKELRTLKIEEVLREMGLQKCSNLMVGVLGKAKGISGGEKKRLALALELLTNPPLMFLDEPMSGLDSYMASNVFTTLKKLSESGRSIICSVHQPTSEMFETFDKLLILCEGRSAYMGPAKEAADFFRSCHYPVPLNYNPAEHFIKVLAIESGSEDLSRKRNEKICDQFLLTEHSESIRNMIDAINCTEDNFVSNQRATEELLPSYKASWIRQFYAVLWRCSANIWREPSVFWNKLVQLLILSLVSGFLFWQQKLDQQGVTSLNGILFHMQLQPSFIFGIGVIFTFPLELPLFFKEHLDGMYRVDVYFLCKIIVEIPQLVMIPLVYATIIYWIVGLYRNIGAYLISCTCVILVCNTATAFGYFISSACENPKIASLSASTLIALLTLIGGFFIHPGSVPFYFIWLKRVSWVVYSNEIMIINQWSRVGSIECDRITDKNSTEVTNSDGNGKCFRHGKDIIEFYGYREDAIGFNFLMIVVLLVCYTLAAFICLVIRSKGSYKMEKSNKSY